MQLNVLATPERGSDMKVTLVVDLDPPAWRSCDEAQRSAWVDRLVSAANTEGYVSEVSLERHEESR